MLTRCLALTFTALAVASAAAQIQVPRYESSFVFGDAFINEGLSLAAMDLQGGFDDRVALQDYHHRMANWRQTLFVTDEDNGVALFDITDPTAVQRSGTFAATAGYASRSDLVHGERLYVTESAFPGGGVVAWKLRIQALTDPGVPGWGTTLNLGSFDDAYDGTIAAVGPRRVAVSTYNRIRIVDDSSTSSVRIEANPISLATPAVGMVANGNYLYLLRSRDMGSCVLEIWNVSVPGRPSRVKSKVINHNAYLNSLSLGQGPVAGSRYLFWGAPNGFDGENLVVVDVSNPAAPSAPFTQSLRNPGGWDVVAEDVDVIGNTAWISGFRPPYPPLFQYEMFLLKVDVTNPRDPGEPVFYAVP